MNYHKGFAAITALLVVFGILVLGGAGYVAMNPQVLQQPEVQDDGVQTEAGDHPEVDHDANEGIAADAKLSIAWKFSDAGEKEHIPYTKVTVIINNVAHEMGTFMGSCSEVGATGGVDGTGLLAGELAAAQCWFAGGGDEIGVFADESGGLELMTGELSESIEGSEPFRGNFTIKSTIKL